jgi:AcrR family transcriptional regulator
VTVQPNAGPATELDGRRARRGRNREAVVDALLALFREGVLSPSVANVAERSGVSLRSVFRYFDDLDEMGRIAIARHTQNVQHLFPLPKIGEGTREDRIHRLVDHRLALYEEVAPVVRATMLRAPFQPVVAAGLAERRAYLRGQIDEQFAPELAQLSDTDRFVVASAADALTSFETLEVLRVDRELPMLRCGTAMRGSLDRVLPGS